MAGSLSQIGGYNLNVMAKNKTDIYGLTNSTIQLSGVVDRTLFVIGVISAGIISIVWVRVGIAFFSNDPNKKIRAKDMAIQAIIGSVIIIMALSGIIYALLHYIILG